MGWINARSVLWGGSQNYALLLSEVLEAREEEAALISGCPCAKLLPVFEVLELSVTRLPPAQPLRTRRRAGRRPRAPRAAIRGSDGDAPSPFGRSGGHRVHGSGNCNDWPVAANGDRLDRWLTAIAHGLFLAFAGAVCLFLAWVGITNALNFSRPTYWGTFTETSTTCQPEPKGQCLITGHWVSDDGTIVKEGVILDGSVAPRGSIRASYHPGGPMGDDANNIVHAGIWSTAELWLPWVFVLVFGGWALLYVRRWRKEAEYEAKVRALDQAVPPEELGVGHTDLS